MPAARTYPSDLAPTLTQTALRDGLRDALSQVFGIAPLKSYAVSTDLFAVWEIVFNPALAYGKAYYRLKVSSALVVTQSVGATWTDATNTLGNPSPDAHSITHVSNQAVKMQGFAGADYKFLVSNQTSVQQLLGYFRPPIAPAFDEASFPRCFVPHTVDLTTAYCSSLTPYGTTTSFSTLWGLAQMASPDSALQVRSLITGGWLWGPSNSGIIAQLGDDLAIGATSGLSRGDIFYDPADNTKQYFVTRGVAGGLLIRI